MQSFNGDLLYEPWEIYDDKGHAFTIFDSYWRKCLKMPFEPEAPLLPPRRLMPPAGKTYLNKDALNELAMHMASTIFNYLFQSISFLKISGHQT